MVRNPHPYGSTFQKRKTIVGAGETLSSADFREKQIQRVEKLKQRQEQIKKIKELRKAQGRPQGQTLLLQTQKRKFPQKRQIKK